MVGGKKGMETCKEVVVKKMVNVAFNRALLGGLSKFFLKGHWELIDSQVHTKIGNEGMDFLFTLCSHVFLFSQTPPQNMDFRAQSWFS